MPTSSLFIVAVVLLFGSVARSECISGNNPAITKLSTPLTTTTTVTFDDIGLSVYQADMAWFSGVGALNVSSKWGQKISLSGDLNTNSCDLRNGYQARNFGLVWNGTAFWSGSTTEKPGFFVAGYPGGWCTLSFDPPIYAFVARAVRDSSFDYTAFVEIYDVDSNLIDCRNLTNLSGTNVFSYTGFISTIPIGDVRFYTVGAPGPYFFADNIQYLACDKGYAWNGTECVDADECLRNPCAENELCENTVGSYTCVCKDGYENKNGTCVDIDECTTLSPCSPVASCSNTNGSFTCTCQDGYSGDGVGPNGCQMTQSPTNGNTPGSNGNTPESNGSPSPNTPSSNAPSSRSPTSRITSSAATSFATLSILISFLVAIIVM